MRGGSVHLQKGFDPDTLLATIERERINFTLLVPTMIYVLLDHPRLDAADLSSLELLLYGASPMSPARLTEGLARIGPVFSQLYGQTECYPVSVLRKADHDAKRPELFESCGFPIAACDVRILDDDDREVTMGQPGEICVCGPHVMRNIGSVRTRPPRRCGTVGCIPATSRAPTSAAISLSSIARRT